MEGENEMRQFLETNHGNKPAKQPERNCVALMKQFCEGLVERVPHKPAKRFEAEQSLRATQSIAVGVVASSFLPGKPDVGGVADKNNKAAKMASEAYGGIEVYTIDQEMIFNMDDSAIVIDDGMPSKREVRGIPNMPRHGDHYACYKLDDGKTAGNYMTVHLSSIVSAGGKMATTVVAVASNLQHTIVLCAAGMCMTSCENKE